MTQDGKKPREPKVLDLFGGREQVEQRLCKTIKAAFIKVLPADIPKFEQELNLPIGFISEVLNDKRPFLKIDDIDILLFALDIDIEDVLGHPQLLNDEVSKAWRKLFKKDMLNGAS